MKKVSIHLFDIDNGEVYKCLIKYARSQKKYVYIDDDDKKKPPSIMDLIKEDYLFRKYKLDDLFDIEFFIIYDKVISIFSDNFEVDNITEIVNNGFYTRRIKYVLVSVLDNDNLSLMIYRAGEKLAEYSLTDSHNDCLTLKTAENVDLINGITGLNLNTETFPFDNCQNVIDTLEKLSSESKIPLNLSFQEIARCPEKYRAKYATCDIYIDTYKHTPRDSFHILKCNSSNRTVCNKIADIFSLKLLPYSECKQRVMSCDLVARSLYSKENYSFFCIEEGIMENVKGIRELSECFKDNYILQYVHAQENKCYLSLFKGGKMVSGLILEVNPEGEITATHTNIELLESVLEFDYDSYIKHFDPKDTQYYMDDYLSKILKLPLLFSCGDIGGFYDLCEPDQYVFDDEFSFEDEEDFDEDLYSSETLEVIKNLFF